MRDRDKDSSLLRDESVRFLVSQNSSLFEAIYIREHECHELTDQLSVLRSSVENLQSEITHLRSCLDTTSSSRMEAERSRERLQIGLSGIVSELIDKSDVLDRLQACKSTVEETLGTLRAHIDVVGNKQSSSAERRAQACAQLSEIQRELGTMRDRGYSLKEEVASYRGRLSKVETEAVVDCEVMASSLVILRQKNTKLIFGIEEAQKSFDKELARISDVKGVLTELHGKCETIRSEMKEILQEREAFLNEKSLLFQKNDQIQAECRNNEALLSAKQTELDHKQDRKTALDLDLRASRDREFSVLENVKELQLTDSKVHSEIVRIGKQLVSHTNIASSMRAKSKILLEQISESCELLKSLCRDNRDLEDESKMLENAKQETELQFLRVSRELSEVEKELKSSSESVASLKLSLDRLLSDQMALKGEIETSENSLREKNIVQRENVQELAKLQSDANELTDELRNVSSELNRIKRVHNDTGAPPVLIYSEVALMDRLEINSFLRYAQSQAQPLPPLIEKLAELLNVLGTARERSDNSLSALKKVNTEISSLRTACLNAEERRNGLSMFKREALTSVLENQLRDTAERVNVVLDDCGINGIDLTFLIETTCRLGVLNHVVCVSLNNNQLRDCSAEICQLLGALPYLSKVELRQNHLDGDQVHSIAVFLRSIDGLTQVSVDVYDGLNAVADGVATPVEIGWVIRGMSGKMTRLTVDVREQRGWLPPADGKLREYQPSQFGMDKSACKIESIDSMNTPNSLSKVRELRMAAETSPTRDNTARPVGRNVPHCQDSSRASFVSDESFVRQLAMSKRKIPAKAKRLGIKSFSPYS